MNAFGMYNVNKFRSIGALGVVAAGMLALSATTASAVTIPLVNAGFETPDNANNDIVGWDESDFGGEGWRAGSFNSPAAPWAGGYNVTNPEGSRVGYLNAQSSMWQNSLHPLTAGETYSLSAWFGNRLNDTLRQTDFVLYADNGSGGLGAVLASVSIGDEIANNEITNGTYAQRTITFDTTLPANAALVSANLGRNLHVFIGHSQAAVQVGEVEIDGVQFSYTPVPEPAALSIVGLGALAVLRRRR